MGTLLDLASLVVVPSGYKEDVVYSVKPTDGSGDLDFTRSNDTATRVNSAGLIEKVRTNLVTYSEEFDNASWTKTNTSVTANSVTSPDGTQNADTITSTGTLPSILSPLLAFASTTNGSIFVKYVSQQWVQLMSGGAVNAYANFDIQNGVIGTVGSNASNAQIENFGNGWYRISVNLLGFTGNTNLYFGFVASGTAGWNTFDPNFNKSLYAWGAQAELGDIATDYIPTTSAAVSVGMTANVPRLDYTGGGCPKLLLEPQRTNLALYSEQLNNAAWSLGGLTITANNITSPDGYTSADKLTEDTSPINHLFYNTNAMTASATSTFSIFYKKGTRRYFAIKLQIGSNSYTQVFDVDSVATTSSSSNGLTGVSTSILSYGNGWVRASVSGTDPSASTACYGIVSLSDSATPTFDPSNYNPVYTGSVTENGYFWGAQLEAGSYATSYINTLSAAVTRGADACSKTGISSLIGQTSGTLYSEFVVNGFADFGTPLCINDGTLNESIWLTTFANGDIRAEVFSLGSIQASFLKTGNVIGQTYKIAIGYASNNFAFFVNGVQVGATDLSGSVPVSMSRVDFDYTNASLFSQSGLGIKEALVFPTRLSNTQIAELTTL